MTTMNRRQFLRATQSVGALAVASTMFPRRLMADALGLPVGIQLYAVRDPLKVDAPGTMKALYKIGYRDVEAAGYGTYTAKDYRKFIDDAGLKCPSAHLGFKKDIDLGPLFDDAHALGCAYATSSVMMPPKPAVKPATPGLGVDGFQYIADLMNDIGAKAKAAGLQYAYHNHSHEFEVLPDGTIGYDFLMKHTDPKLVKFEIDCGWMCVAGHDPAAYIKKYPGRIKMLHIKDFKKPEAPYIATAGGTRPAGTELGQGFIDYKKIFAAAKGTGIVNVFAEQEEPYAVSPMASAQVDYDYLHSFS